MTNVHQLFAEPVAATGDFEAIWKLWPRKDGKAVARSKYLAILRGGFRTKTLDKSSGQFIDMELAATADEIESGVKAYLASQVDRNTYRLKDEGRFIPHLSTWLGRSGWEDHL